MPLSPQPPHPQPPSPEDEPEHRPSLTHDQAVRLGRRGAKVLHSRYNAAYLTAEARRRFMSKFASEEERSAYFRALRQHQRRYARSGGTSGGTS